MSKVLFIYAHMDDETIMSYGTINRLKEKGNDIFVAILCGLGRDSDNSNVRQHAFNKIINDLGVKSKIFPHYDLSLTEAIVKEDISSIFSDVCPEIVFTHSSYDNHIDHRLVSQEVLVQCRSTINSSIKQLYQSVLPNYKWTYNLFGNFNPNLFVDISKYINKKQTALKLYDFEFPDSNTDLRSIFSILQFNKLYGIQNATDFCEAFQQIFKLM